MACRTVTLLVQDFTGFSSAFSWAVGLVDPLLENARLVGTYPVVVGLEIVLKPRNLRFSWILLWMRFLFLCLLSVVWKNCVLLLEKLG